MSNNDGLRDKGAEVLHQFADTVRKDALAKLFDIRSNKTHTDSIFLASAALTLLKEAASRGLAEDRTGDEPSLSMLSDCLNIAKGLEATIQRNIAGK